MKLSQLRVVMKRELVDCYIVPSEDAHQSEYTAAAHQRRSFISGFTGSAGTVLVTENEAHLFTDGRYTLQAKLQLDSHWKIHVTPYQSYLSLLKNLNIGFDPSLISIQQFNSFGSSCNLVPIKNNLVDEIWVDKPSQPKNHIRILETSFSGESTHFKLSNTRKSFLDNTWGLVVTALDDLAWLLNMRGSDVECNPVFFGYALILNDWAGVYLDECQLGTREKQYLIDNNIHILPYSQIFNDISRYSSLHPNKKLWTDPRASLAVQEAAGGIDRIHLQRSPIVLAKCVKNKTEIQGIKTCHIRDAASLCEYFAWLESELRNGVQVTEHQGAEKLESIRRTKENFVGLSFDTISSTGSNGAIIHYKPERDTCKVISIDDVYLCDSGAQYLDGTTDVTRTLHFGSPTEFEREAYTRVLKGHINIDKTVFPKGTTGYVLDVLARSALWQAGLEFRHGTGHGVGHFLNVHEGPIGPRINFNDVPLTPGMIITNEPGYYHDVNTRVNNESHKTFGIRIENVMVVVPKKTRYSMEGVESYGFERVTVVPICLNLLDVGLLNEEEISWINAYHEEVLEKVSPLLSGDALLWLVKECRKI